VTKNLTQFLQQQEPNQVLNAFGLRPGMRQMINSFNPPLTDSRPQKRQFQDRVAKLLTFTIHLSLDNMDLIVENEQVLNEFRVGVITHSKKVMDHFWPEIPDAIDLTSDVTTPQIEMSPTVLSSKGTPNSA